MEYWPVGDAKHQATLEKFVLKLEKFLGVKRTPISLELLWKETKPEGLEEGISLGQYFEYVFEWAANLDQWNHFLEPFIKEYKETYNHEPILNPQLQYKW